MPTALSTKTLVMIVGPTAIGKSTLMHAVTDQDDRFGYVSTFTTRPAREGSATTYRHITADQAEAKKRTGDYYTYLTHPTTGHVYGTDLESFAARINLLDTLAGSVEAYRELPFGRTVTLSLTTDPASWKTWLLARYPAASPERTKRLHEAVQSIKWSLAQTGNHHWLVNRPGQEERVAKELIELIDTPRSGGDASDMAREMLKLVNGLLSYD